MSQPLLPAASYEESHPEHGEWVRTSGRCFVPPPGCDLHPAVTASNAVIAPKSA